MIPAPDSTASVLPARNATGESPPNEEPMPKWVPENSGPAGGAAAAAGAGGGGVASCACADGASSQRTETTETTVALFRAARHQDTAGIAASLCLCDIRTNVRITNQSVPPRPRACQPSFARRVGQLCSSHGKRYGRARLASHVSRWCDSGRYALVPGAMPTASAAFLDALTSAGVSYLFANFGSDHPAMLEALAAAAATGRAIPELITCPAEFVALSAAQGVAQITGRGQAVLVHVECGTQSLGGAVHNAARARIPVLIFAGASPSTQGGELAGSRNEFIHWLQDVRDQRGIVRGYVKYDNEVRTGRNIGQLVHRALQLAHSDPRGPVYLMAAREVLEEEVPPAPTAPAAFSPLAPQALPDDDVRALAGAL